MKQMLAWVFLGFLALSWRVAAAQEDADIEAKLREAEARLQAAAEEVARLSESQVRKFMINRSVSGDRDRPRLGIALASDGDEDGANGVRIMSVSPGSAAAEAGVETGDRLVAVGSAQLEGSDPLTSSRVIADLLDGRKAGDTIDLTVLRNGSSKTLTATLNDQSFLKDSFSFAFSNDGDPGNRVIRIEEGLVTEMDFEKIHELALEGLGEVSFLTGADSAFGDMELVELSETLGQYFGAKSGLLVVRAPQDDALGFRDGDVILGIGGRTPQDVGHAMRILRSYSPGESLTIDILRQRKDRTLDIVVPESVGRSDLMFPGTATTPHVKLFGKDGVVVIDDVVVVDNDR